VGLDVSKLSCKQEEGHSLLPTSLHVGRAWTRARAKRTRRAESHTPEPSNHRTQQPLKIEYRLRRVLGGDLLQRCIDLKSLSEDVSARVCTQLLDAVGYLHSQNIVHRDIKPENSEKWV